MKDLLLALLKNAKSAVDKEGYLPSLAFPLVPNSKPLEPIPIIFEDDNEKLRTFFALGAFCKENKITDLVLGLNSCYRQIPKNEKNREYFFKNLSTERPSLYPDHLRENYILLQYVDFKNQAKCLSLTCKYQRKNGKTVYGRPTLRMNIESVILKIVYDGWNAK